MFLTALFAVKTRAQDIDLLHQFNGRYDFTFVGNTMNTMENNSLPGIPSPPCVILSSSSATLQLAPGDSVEKALLYWAGSGNGDFEVKLNDTTIIPDRTFLTTSTSNGFPYFSAVKDVTEMVQETGNGIYTLSDLDLSAIISSYCPFGGNFAGWALIIVYENASLPLNQLNLYEGMQRIPEDISINLGSLNVIDNSNAKIGFLAWEGDKNIAEDEFMLVNGEPLPESVLNPSDNAFNGTNTVTGSDQLFNMDIDIYDVSGNINVGATSALIELTSGRDFVMVNAVVTKFNSQLPDATINIDQIIQTCDQRTLLLSYTVSNFNSTDPLPANTQISIFAEDTWLQSAFTENELQIGESQSKQILLTIPEEWGDVFNLILKVDSDAAGIGAVKELIETNNTASTEISMWVSPDINTIPTQFVCDQGFGKATFDLGTLTDSIMTAPGLQLNFYSSQPDAEQNTNPLPGDNLLLANSETTIYYRLANNNCFSISTLTFHIRKCPPTVYNLVDSVPDNFYDEITISGLRDIFLNYRLYIYNRWGTLVWSGKNSMELWNGRANVGSGMMGRELPEGTYYYVLELNDPEFPNPIAGFVYLRN